MNVREYSRIPLMILFSYVIISFALIYFSTLKRPNNRYLLRWCLLIALSWLIIPTVLNLCSSQKAPLESFKKGISACIIILSLSAQLFILISLTKINAFVDKKKKIVPMK